MLAALAARGGGAKLVTLHRSLGASRDAIRRTLAGLVAIGLVAPNPGYGHPMRPEYVLTPAGRTIAPAAAALANVLADTDLEDVGLRKWSLTVLGAVAAGQRRFNRLRDALPRVSPRALATSLRDLQDAGLLDRYLVDADPPHTEYAPTATARRLLPLLDALDDAWHAA